MGKKKTWFFVLVFALMLSAGCKSLVDKGEEEKGGTYDGEGLCLYEPASLSSRTWCMRTDSNTCSALIDYNLAAWVDWREVDSSCADLGCSAVAEDGTGEIYSCPE